MVTDVFICDFRSAVWTVRELTKIADYKNGNLDDDNLGLIFDGAPRRVPRRYVFFF